MREHTSRHMTRSWGHSLEIRRSREDRLQRRFFYGVQAGRADVTWVDKDTAPATRRLTKLVAGINSGSRRGLKDGFVHDF